MMNKIFILYDLRPGGRKFLLVGPKILGPAKCIGPAVPTPPALDLV